jgi:membrane-associated phospholipid phosphatase
MKRVSLALLVWIAGNLSCGAEQNLFNINPYGSDAPDDVSSPSTTPSAPPLTMGTTNPAAPAPLAPLEAPVEDLFERNYWYLLLLDTKEVFTAPARWDLRDWLTLGGVTAGIGIVAIFDEDIQHAIRHARNDTMTEVFDRIQPLGNEYAIGIIGTFYFAGVILKDPRAKATALDSISATAIASGLIDNSVKYVVGRGRPTDGHGAYHFQPFGGQDSFPSGHTTEAFALASVITEHYHSPWIAVTCYGLAGTVGYARLNNNRHWPSDVLAGAAIGTFVGKTVVRFNRAHRKIKLQPIVSSDVHGVELSMAW